MIDDIMDGSFQSRHEEILVEHQEVSVKKSEDDDYLDDPAEKTVMKLSKAEQKILASKRKAEKHDQKLTFALNANALQTQNTDDRTKRVAYLLGQTDLFAHFLKKEDIEEVQAAMKKNKEKGKSKDGINRHRKTEIEEDEELLNADENQNDETVVFTESPSYIKNGVMRDYQVQGLNWLVSLFQNGINGILADEMGLGKTLQTISFIGYLKHFKNVNGPHLVIVPKSTLHNWVKEFQKWVPDIDVFLFHGMKEERSLLIKDTLLQSKFDVVITSFEMCLLEKQHLKKFSWQYIIIDEAHRIKNENSALSQIVRLFNCRNRLLLTGTPLQNNLHELWALLNFLLPDVFGSSEDFDSWFLLQGGADKQDAVVEQLHKVLRPFLLRRIKADVEKSLLPKQKTNLYVGMSSMQKSWYQKLLEKDIDAVNGTVAGKGKKNENKTRLLNIVMQLRKCCNHPYLFNGAEIGPPYSDQALIDNAGKMAILDKLLPMLKSQGSRVLMFSQMSRMLDIRYCRLDGSTPHEERVVSIDEYNKEGSEKFIFLLTTRAGGLGINLATADIVIMYDNDWNPQVDLQAEDRAHRIGQKKQVKVFRFITEDSVEEKVIDKATQKLRLDQLVIQQGRSVQPNKTASKDDLLNMIRHGAQTIMKDTESTITNENIEDIIQKSMKKTMELEEKYKQMGLDDLQKFTLDGANKESVYKWDGDDYSNKRAAEGFWIQPAKRKRKTNYDINKYYQDALRTKTNQAVPSNVRAPRHKGIQYYDFQFKPERLLELQELMNDYNLKEAGHKFPAVKPSGETMTEEEERKEKNRLEMQTVIDEAEPLTEEELAEKEALSKVGDFDHWSKRDFQLFCKANEKYGRKNLVDIAKDIEGKTLEDVEKYAKVFWERYHEINDYQRIVNKIEEGERKISQLEAVKEVLTQKISGLKSPIHQLKINYGQNRSKSYTEEEDRFVLVMLDKFGYGGDDTHEKIRQEIKRSNLFRFNWFIKSRTALEIGKRCNTLLLCLMKEKEDLEKKQLNKEKSNTQIENAVNLPESTNFTKGGRKVGASRPLRKIRSLLEKKQN
ncbi:hypothetical protein HDU92_003874 [Lobulomyces angularis]|nr:hypothetical protein HDU92_003874 [Lobulomyces angularis]